MISFCIILPCITSFHIKEVACPAKQDFGPIFVVLGKYKETIQEWHSEGQQWLNTCAPPNCRLLEEIWYTLPCDVQMYKLSCTVPLAQRWEAKNSCYPLSHAENMGCSMEDLMFFGLSSSAYPAEAGDGLQVDWAVLTSAFLELETMSCSAGWFSDWSASFCDSSWHSSVVWIAGKGRWGQRWGGRNMRFSSVKHCLVPCNGSKPTQLLWTWLGLLFVPSKILGSCLGCFGQWADVFVPVKAFIKKV